MCSLHAVCCCVVATSKLNVLLVTFPTATNHDDELCVRLIDEQWQQGIPRAPFCRQSTSVLRGKVSPYRSTHQNCRLRRGNRGVCFSFFVASLRALSHFWLRCVNSFPDKRRRSCFEVDNCPDCSASPQNQSCF